MPRIKYIGKLPTRHRKYGRLVHGATFDVPEKDAKAFNADPSYESAGKVTIEKGKAKASISKNSKRKDVK